MKKFCCRCGTRLAPDNRIIGYNEETGEPLHPFLGNKVCPNKYCRESPNYSMGW